MRKILIILGLILCGSALFGQSPRIRLNQITKDSLTGSVVLSGSDSNMVYSRDFFLNLTDSVLILFGDTLSTTATAFTGVATDLTLTGNGTVGDELKVDTAIIATVSALADSLAGIVSSVTTDLTLTGDGSVATPLKVDTAVIATIKALSDSLATLSFATNQDISDSLATLSFASLQDITDTLDLNTRDYITGLRLTDTLNTNSRGFLTQNQTITLTDDATGTGTTSISVTVVDDSHNHTISTLTGIQDSLNSKAALVHTHTISDVAFLQDSLDAKANDSDLNNYLLTANYIVDSTRINLTGDTAYYYQNGVLIGTGAIAGGGGGSGTVTSVDVSGGTTGLTTSGGPVTTSGTITLAGTLDVDNGGTGATSFTAGQMLKGNGTSAIQAASNLREDADTVYVDKFINVDTATLYVDAVNNRVGIGTSSPQYGIEVLGSGANGILAATRTGTNGGGVSTIFYTNSDAKTANDGIIFPFNMRNSNNSLATYASISAYIGDPGAGFHEGYLTFETTSNATQSEKMRIAANGNVGIGTIAPGSRLHTKSSAANDALLVEDDSGACEAQPTTTGLTWSCSSDQRLKTDIQIPAAVLNYVKNIPLKDYTVIKTAERVMGPIAQELLETYPELVTTGEDGYYRVSSLGSWTLVKAIQEQQAIIETQQAEIETLKTQYNDLLQRIINLENK